MKQLYIENLRKNITRKLADTYAVDVEKSIDLTTCTRIEQKFEELSLKEIWISLPEDHPNLSKRTLLRFRATYLSEACFCTMLQQYPNIETNLI